MDKNEKIERAKREKEIENDDLKEKDLKTNQKRIVNPDDVY